MNTVITLIVATLAFAGGTVVQWLILRAMHRAKLTRLCARHREAQRNANDCLVQARRQVNQLQHDLAAARLQAKRHKTDAGSSRENQVQTKEALLRSLDGDSRPQHRVPNNGFADTLPSEQYPHGLDMLLRQGRTSAAVPT